MKSGANRHDLNVIERMKADGISIEEIARTVGIYPEVVKNLIKSFKFKEGTDVSPKPPPLSSVGPPPIEEPTE